MTAEEFNALPLEARRYIEKQKTCLSCGRANDLDAHYRNYLAMSNKKLFTLRMGAIAFKRENGENGVLYPIHPSDTEDQIKVKLQLALELNAIRPDKFDVISVEGIEKILGPAEETEEEETEEEETEEGETEEGETEEGETEEVKPKKLHGAAKAAAERKAAAKDLE